jgi:hypothetical protein
VIRRATGQAAAPCCLRFIDECNGDVSPVDFGGRSQELSAHACSESLGKDQLNGARNKYEGRLSERYLESGHFSKRADGTLDLRSDKGGIYSEH